MTLHSPTTLWCSHHDSEPDTAAECAEHEEAHNG